MIFCKKKKYIHYFLVNIAKHNEVFYFSHFSKRFEKENFRRNLNITRIFLPVKRMVCGILKENNFSDFISKWFPYLKK